MILLDIGGSYIQCADGRKIPVPSSGTREEIAAALREAVGTGDPSAPLGMTRIGIAIPGPFDYKEGIFLMKHKYAAVYGERFRDLICHSCHSCHSERSEESIDIRFMHDVNAPLAGAIKMLNLKNAALVTLGTGLGFSYAIDGHVMENENGSPALSLWNTPYKDGILEDVASARGISSAYTKLSGTPCKSAYDVAKKACDGDLHAIEAYSNLGQFLGEALQPILEDLNIKTLLMGGQISKSLSLMIRPLKNALPDVNIIQAPENAVFEGLATLFKH